jgi:hypothetical protein
MNAVCSAHRLARRLHRAVQPGCMRRRIGDAIGLACGAAGRLRASVQTACPRPGSLGTPGWPGLRPSPAPGAPGTGRAANWSPQPWRRGWADDNGEGKIKGPARSWPQSLVCTWWGTARQPVAHVPWGGAAAHGCRLRRVPFAPSYTCLGGSEPDGSF